MYWLKVQLLQPLCKRIHVSQHSFNFQDEQQWCIFLKLTLSQSELCQQPIITLLSHPFLPTHCCKYTFYPFIYKGCSNNSRPQFFLVYLLQSSALVNACTCEIVPVNNKSTSSSIFLYQPSSVSSLWRESLSSPLGWMDGCFFNFIRSVFICCANKSQTAKSGE